MSSIELHNVSKKFGGIGAVDQISLKLSEHERFVLFGCSGAGKSTLLRILAGLEQIDEGHVVIDGKVVDRVPPHQRGVAMLGQDAALYPQLTVRKNLQTVAKSSTRRLQKDSSSQIEGLLRQFGIEHVAEHLPSQLSGGEGQRAALAKAMIAEHRILLLDEPLSQLDGTNRESAILALEEVAASFAPTTVMVSHDPMDALRLADRIGVMHQGKLVDVGAPERIYQRPRCRISGQLLSPLGMNWVDQQESAELWHELASKFRDLNLQTLKIRGAIEDDLQGSENAELEEADLEDSELGPQRFLGVRGERISILGQWRSNHDSGSEASGNSPDRRMVRLQGRVAKVASVGFATLVDVEVVDGRLRCVLFNSDSTKTSGLLGEFIEIEIDAKHLCTVSD